MPHIMALTVNTVNNNKSYTQLFALYLLKVTLEFIEELAFQISYMNHVVTCFDVRLFGNYCEWIWDSM